MAIFPKVDLIHILKGSSMIDVFWANWHKDKPLGNIENLLKNNPLSINDPEFNVQDSVRIRCHKHLKTTLHGALGIVEKVFPESGTYLIRLSDSGNTVLLNKHELDKE